MPEPDRPDRGSATRDAPATCRSIVEFNRWLALETEGKVLDPAILDAGCRLRPGRSRPPPLLGRRDSAGEAQPVVGQAAITREWSDWRNGWIWWFQSVYVAAPISAAGASSAPCTTRSATRPASAPDVIGLRLYVEDSNAAAHKTYQALGMKPGGYSVYEELWIDRL